MRLIITILNFVNKGQIVGIARLSQLYSIIGQWRYYRSLATGENNYREKVAMSYQCIIYEKKEAVAKITLNRPEVLNAFNRQMLREILQALEDAEKDNKIRVVVITGKGRAFCVGLD